jgi:hypothetical protein
MSVDKIQISRLLRKALPEPLFGYFSNAKALCSSANAMYVMRTTGSLSLVAGTSRRSPTRIEQ